MNEKKEKKGEQCLGGNYIYIFVGALSGSMRDTNTGFPVGLTMTCTRVLRRAPMQNTDFVLNEIDARKLKHFFCVLPPEGAERIQYSYYFYFSHQKE